MMIAAMMVATLSASAQEVEVGQFYLKPMVGATMTTITKVDNSKMKVGLLGGAEVGVKVAEPFDVTAGLLFMMQGTKGKDSEFTKNASTTLTYLNVPIMANVYVLPGLALKAGVQPFSLDSCSLLRQSGLTMNLANGLITTLQARMV